ncbi:MAG: 1-acyl-sn-glycerol-3-phosphate acyltransferase [Clostridia bacterium]|nr:1-acyl-sn-glycerol-3-phosphate acyltransferase [Clostridia bacterium]
MTKILVLILIALLSGGFYALVLTPFDYIDILYVALVFIGLVVTFCLLYLIFIVCYSLTLSKTKEYKKESKFVQIVTASLARNILFFTNTKLTVKGKEKIPTDTRFLIVSNHKNAFDPICFNLALKGYNVGFISKPENFKIPFASNLISREFYMPINRENDREALKTILKAINLAKNNICSIGLYPEGTRNKTEKPLLEFKTGGFKIAQKANIPIVVAIIKNIKKVNLNPFKKSVIEIEILDVIYPDTFETSTVDLGNRIYNIMLTNLQ